MMSLARVARSSGWLAHTQGWTGALLQARQGFATVDSSAPETHDDFKTQFKSEPITDVKKQIEADISTNDVFVFMKGTPASPQCGFSNMACRVLDAYGVKYGARNVLADAALREGIKKFTSWPTIPQVFVKGEFIGGADILYEMHQKEELAKLLEPIIKEQQAAAKK